MGGNYVLIPTGHVQDRVIPAPEALIAIYPLGVAAAPCPSDLLLRREAVEAVGGFEAEFTGARTLYEDQALLAKIYLAFPVWFSRAVWLNYRQHEGSCVAMVKREGRYDEVRLYFLDWFARYMHHRPALATSAIRRALGQALWRYRHPLAHKIGRKLRHLLMLPKEARTLISRPRPQ